MNKDTVLKYVEIFEDIFTRYTYSFGEDVVKHQDTLDCSVQEALQKISSFIDTTGYGCCLYIVTKFLEKCPEATFAYIPEENPYDNGKRTSSKTLAIINNRVYDIVEAVEHKAEYSVEEAFARNCNIPIAEYCKKNLLPDEELTILRNPHECLEENFVRYFFFLEPYVLQRYDSNGEEV